MGSRYGGLKQLDPMGPGGETVLDYSVFDAIRAGFDRVIFVIREDFAVAFKEGIGSRFSGRIQVDYAFQSLDDLPSPHTAPPTRTKPWGTTHAIRAARELIDGPFAVINADDFYGRDAYATAAAFIGGMKESDCAIVGYPLENTLSEHGQVNRGICEMTGDGILSGVEEFLKIGREDNGKITGEGLAGERKELQPGDAVSMNFWIFPAKFMTDLEVEFLKFIEKNGCKDTGESYIPTVVDSLVKQRKIICRVLETNASWFGVTYPEDKAHVVASIQNLISQGEYSETLDP